MPDTTNQQNVPRCTFRSPIVFPYTKLQTLDRRVGKDQLFFGKEEFAASVNAWNQIPVIFHPEGKHPEDFAKVTRDPYTAAKEIGGKLVGCVSYPRIVIHGGPRLMAQLDIYRDEDGKIVSLWHQGKLFPSTAFSAPSDGDRITAPPIPNHVLLFPYEKDTVQPGDYGAYVNTMEVTSPMESNKPESIETTQPNFYNRIKDVVVEILSNFSDEGLIEKLEVPVPDHQKELAEKEQEISSLKTRINELTATYENDLNTLRAELKVQTEKYADARFNTILTALPAGMKATDVQRESLRKQFKAGDAEGILLSVLTHTSRSGVTEPAGEPFMNSEHETPFETVGNLNVPRRRSEE